MNSLSVLCDDELNADSMDAWRLNEVMFKFI